jgi:DNA segregation ATPase FtsK/SpoIIIE, S-DNA-T family
MADWRLPTVDLPRAESAQIDLEEMSKVLVRTLADLGCPAAIHRVFAGATVIRFELIPENGTTMRQFTRLRRLDDISYAMATDGVRILAPIPGESLVGIEIPSPRRRDVFLGDIQ